MPYSRKNIFLCMRQRVLVDLLYLPENVKNLSSTYSAGQSRVPKSNNTMAGSLKQTMNKKGSRLFMPNFSGKQIILDTNLEEVRNFASDNISNFFDFQIEIFLQ